MHEKSATDYECSNKDTTYPQKEGVIAILDALGSKGLSCQQAKGFLEKRDEVLNEASTSALKMYRWLIVGSEDNKRVVREVTEVKPVFSTFGDTILVSWEFPTIPDPIHVLAICGQFLSALVALYMSKDILFRGAMSYGKYVTDDENSVIGPAVTNAAEWYDKPQLVGVMVEPDTARWLYEAKEKAIWSNKKYRLKEVFSLYPQFVVKPSSKIATWSVLWPLELIRRHNKDWDHDAPIEPRARLISYLNKLPVPPGAEVKYVNTLAYFDWCCEEYPEIVEEGKREREGK
jgi:hypothetical protein